jgi:hypothetical protein
MCPMLDAAITSIYVAVADLEDHKRVLKRRRR